MVSGGLRKQTGVNLLVDTKQGVSLHSFEILEAVQGNFAGAGDELQQLRSFLVAHASDDAPKPGDLGAVRCVVVILGVSLPIVDVDFGQTRDEQLKLLLIKDCNKFCWNDVVESSHKVFKLLPDRGGETIADLGIDIFSLVLLRDGDVSSVGY